MATAPINENPVCEPVSLMPVTNKLQDRMNTLREVIDSKKSLVRRISDEMKQLIDEKTQLVIRELEAIWDEANQRMNKRRDEINKQIEEINKRKSEIEKFFKDLNQTPCLDQITEAIESVKREMNIEIPFIKLNWKVNELRECITTLCSCDQRIVKFEEDTPIQLKWSSCDKGEQDNQLLSPWGIAIDSMNDEIYVAADSTNRVKIFSRNGEWVNSLKYEVMTNPENIIIIHNSIFVQCLMRIVKFNKSTLMMESYRSYEYELSGICNDNTHIYVGEYGRMKFTVLTYEMKEEKRISLITQYKQDNTLIIDISLARDEVYVCFIDSDYPIQSFSKQGTLTRCIIHKDMLNEVLYFCLDQQLNIILADGGCSQVKIFSNEGKLIAKFGKEGSAPGEFTYLSGIAVDDLFTIVTVDWKEHNRLQAFSYL